MKTQPHIVLKLVVVCLLLMSCTGQKVSRTMNNKPIVKKLDNNYLKKIKNKNQKIQFSENDSIIELEGTGNYYFERRHKNNEKVKKSFVYNKTTHLLEATGTLLNDLPIGIHTTYNEKGELIREINFDKNFPFSVYDLIAKIKTTHQIDLNDGQNNISVSRVIDKETGKHIYEILYDKTDNGTYKYITVDGATGQILSEGDGYSICGTIDK